jgi:hypothetical protein
MNSVRLVGLASALALAMTLAPRATVAASNPVQEAENKDTLYQEAVKTHDIGKMKDVLSDYFVQVTGDGTTYDKNELLRLARSNPTTYDRHDVQSRKGRRYGDRTVMVTAQLWIKGKYSVDGKPFECKLWYSNLYVKDSGEWRLAFSQASQPQSSDCPYP